MPNYWPLVLKKFKELEFLGLTYSSLASCGTNRDENILFFYLSKYFLYYAFKKHFPLIFMVLYYIVLLGFFVWTYLFQSAFLLWNFEVEHSYCQLDRCLHSNGNQALQKKIMGENSLKHWFYLAYNVNFRNNLEIYNKFWHTLELNTVKYQWPSIWKRPSTIGWSVSWKFLYLTSLLDTVLRFFVQFGHQTIYASCGNMHFFTK